MDLFGSEFSNQFPGKNGPISYEEAEKSLNTSWWKSIKDALLPGTSVTSSGDVLAEQDAGGGIFDPNAFWRSYNERAGQATAEQRAWSAAQAQKQMDFQERMSSTAYQRAAEDMKAAGLNPYLLMSGGMTAAASPSGAMATTSAQDVYDKNDTLERDLAILSALMGLVNTAAGIGRAFIPRTTKIK